MTVLTYLEHADGAVDEPSLQAATLARSLAGDRTAHAVVASNSLLQAIDGPVQADTVHVAVHDVFASYAPRAIAEAIVELAERLGATAVVGPGTERGNEVLANVAALLDLPLAANCVSVTGSDGDPGPLGRQPARGGPRRRIDTAAHGPAACRGGRDSGG